MSNFFSNPLSIQITNPNNNKNSFRQRSRKVIKSQEKEQKFFRNIFPKIITERSKNEVEHTVSKVDKKVKEISLSVESFNNYMGSYKDILKYPPNDYYSTERIRHFIPFKMLKNVNLNKKKDFYSTFNSFNTYSNRKILSLNDSNSILNHKKLIISKSNLGNQEIKKKEEIKNFASNDNEIFKYFLDGIFLTEPEKLKYLNIDEKKMHQHPLDDADFDFYSKYLENIYKNENFTDVKKKEYEMSFFKKLVKLKFILELSSVCLYFEKIDIKNIKNPDNLEYNQDKIDEKDNIDSSKNEKEHNENVQKLYLPFKYIPLIFLLSYSSFKVFISEIIIFDDKNNKFNFIESEIMENIIKKYSDFCRNKILMHNIEKNESVFKDIIYNENEFHYNYIFYWIIYDKREEKIKKKMFKFKIIFPLISLKIDNYEIKFNKFINKCIIFELIKNNFISWDRYILYNLFMDKKLRKSLGKILKKERNFFLNQYSAKNVGPAIDNTIAKKNNFDFFLTELSEDLNYNYYYYFAPYKATIMSKVRNKFNIHDSVSLKLNDTKKIYKLAKHFGLIGIISKCMFYNKLTNKYYFAFKVLQDTQDIISNYKKFEKEMCIINNKCSKAYKVNGAEIHLLIRECLLCQKEINIFNYIELKYYKLPYSLLQYVLDEEITEDKTISILFNESDIIINSNEIKDYKEFIYKKDLNNNLSFSAKKGSEKRKGRKKFASNKTLKQINFAESNNNMNKFIYVNRNTSKNYTRSDKCYKTMVMKKLDFSKPSIFSRLKESQKKLFGFDQNNGNYENKKNNTKTPSKIFNHYSQNQLTKTKSRFRINEYKDK